MRLLLALFVTITLSACVSEIRPIPKFQIGQLVKMKVGGYQAQIIDMNCFRERKTCHYDVRISGVTPGQKSDTPVIPLTTIILINEFEMEVSE